MFTLQNHQLSTTTIVTMHFTTVAASLLCAASAVHAQTGFYLANTKLTTYVPGPIGDDGNDRFVVSGFCLSPLILLPPFEIMP